MAGEVLSGWGRYSEAGGGTQWLGEVLSGWGEVLNA